MRAVKVMLVVLSMIVVCSVAGAETFRFTASADNRPYDSANLSRWEWLLDEMDRLFVDDEGVFHIMPGDFDPPQTTDATLKTQFGSDVVWYPVVGNHEAETADDMTWIRNASGDLPYVVNWGPSGCQTTTYSFDYGNAHFVAINEYYDGTSDTGTDGDVVDALYEWLVDDLAANTKPAVFVIGHEPAYPEYAHVGDSLDGHEANRDRFWKLLNDNQVIAYLCGHTHWYYAKQVDGADWEPFTWQIDCGNAGNPRELEQTFVDVAVTDTDVTFTAWQGLEGNSYTVRETWTVEIPFVAASNPSPADGATGVLPASVALSATVENPSGTADPVDVDFFGRENPTFSIVVLPDTQNYVNLLDAGTPEIFTSQTQWIADNAATMNTVFVTHEGDITDNTDRPEQGDVPAEWERANTSMSLLDGVAPYGLLPGNHDYPTTYFNTYFPYTRYDSESWYGGHYGTTNDNSYQLFSAGGDDYIILHIEYNPGSTIDDPVIAWADGVLKANADRIAIITTHAYLDANGNRTSEGTGIWNVLVQGNDNVYFVLCGHVSAEAMRTDLVGGREVHQLLANYQGRANGGDGWLRIMTFDPDADEVYVQTYSPWLDDSETDTNSDFVLAFDMTSVGYSSIGSDLDVPSGMVAATPWPGLSMETEYEWYVTVSDTMSPAITAGPLWDFTTASLKASNPSPANGATDVDVDADLNWSAGIDAVSHDVYFGTDAGNLPPVSTLQEGTTYEPGMLAQGTTYYWAIDEFDSDDNLLAAGDLWSFTTIPPGPVVIVPAGSTWKYNDTNTDFYSAGWPSVDDASWPTGPAPLGFGTLNTGEVGINTTLTMGSPRYPCYYFRHSFTVTSAYDSLTVKVLRDDGCVVYLNGTELVDARSNMPASAITHDTLSVSAAGGADETTYFETSVNPALLTIGTNVLAVDVHQCNTTSSDIGFDLELEGVIAADPQSARNPDPANGATDVDVDADLSWSAGIDAVSHDVYFGTDADNLPLVSAEQNVTTYDPGTLQEGVTYYWAIDEHDSVGGVTAGGVWSFTTAVPPPLTFQQGVNGYSGMVDTMIRSADPDTVFADSATQYDGTYQYQYNADTDSSGGPSQVLMRFDDIIGSNAGQIPAGSTILSATLRIRSTDDGNGGNAHALLQSWIDTVITWNNSFGGDGIQADDNEAAAVADDGVSSNSPDTDVDLDVTATVQAWANGTAVNNGWAILPNGTNGWHMAAAEHPTLDYRPELIVSFSTVENETPVATDDAYSTDEDTPLPVPAPGVLDNDTDADGHPLTAVLVSDVSNGTLTLNSDGSFNYAPDADFSGPEDSFTYRANDGISGSNVATVTITVNAVNDAPVANDDSASTLRDVSVVIDVLSNDNDVEEDPLSVGEITQPSNGSVVNNGANVTYTPAPGYVGEDSFTYRANDGTANGNAATVTVAVDAPGPTTLFSDGFESGNLATGGWTSSGSVIIKEPAAYEGSYGVQIGGVAWIEKSVSTVGYADIHVKYARKTKGLRSGEFLTVEWSADGTAWIAIESTSDTAWAQPDIALGAEAGENAAFSVRFRTNASKTNRYAAVDSVEIIGTTAGPVNNPPVADADTYSLDEDGTLNVSAPGVLGNDSDPENDPLAAVLAGDVGNGVLNLSGDGSFSYTPNANFNGTDSFTYVANDGTSNSNTATVTITVDPINDAPVANSDSATTNEDTAVVIDVLTNDTDADPGDTLSVQSVTQGSNGSVVNNGVSVTYTPDPAFVGEDTFSYTLSDGNGGTDTATVSVTVTEFNNPPVANDDSAITDEDTAVIVDVLANDTDADPTDTLSVQSVTQGTNGSVVNNGTSITYTPGANFNGSDAFTYTVSDGKGGTDTANVAVTILAVNDPPSAGDDSAATDEDTAVVVDVLANDSDIDGDTLSVQSATNGSNGSVVVNGDNTVTYTPDAGYDGDDSFTYTISDGNGGTDTATVTITVNPAGSIVYVESIGMSLEKAGKNWKAIATVFISEAQSGASVLGNWHLGTTGTIDDKLIQEGVTGITDGTGTVVIVSVPKKAKSDEVFTFVVTDVVLGGYVYDPGQGITENSITVP